MRPAGASGQAEPGGLGGWRAVLLFVVAVTAARIAWSAWMSPFALIEDEAHYWEWSRRLGWSYYSKGPGVAWAIAAATWLFGEAEWAVRLPAAVVSGLGSLAVAGLARDVCRDDASRARAGLIGAVAYQALPGVSVTALLTTIDGPYLACWAAACWMGWRAMGRSGRSFGWAWVALGLALAAGFLFKYTILLLVVGLVGWWVWGKRGEPAERPRPAWVFAGAACVVLGLVPVLVWNAGHDWATVRHLLGHLGAPGGDVAPGGSWSALDGVVGPAIYLGMLLAVGGPIGVLMTLGLANARWRPATTDPGGWFRPGAVAYLVWCAAPIFAFYLFVSVASEVEANWAMAGFVSLVPVGAWAAVDGARRIDHGLRFCWRASVFALLLLLLGPVVLGAAAEGGAGWARLVAPVQRAMGIRDVAAEAGRLGEALRAETGLEPAYFAVHYGRASLLAYYLPGRPVVYCASSLFGGRATQYDLWPQTDLRSDAVIEGLRGRPAVLLGGSTAAWSTLFGEVRPLGRLKGEPKRDREAFLGLGYGRGIGEVLEDGGTP